MPPGSRPQRAGALLALIFFSACGKDSAPASQSAEPSPAASPATTDGHGMVSAPAAPRPAPPAPPPGGGVADILFTDVSAESGLALENVSGDPVRKLAIPENLGQGAAFLDYDGDGRLDLFVANGDVFPGQTPRAEPRSALYRNLDGFRFEDVTKKAGLEFRAWCHGAWAVDFDGDGHTDLYVTCYLRPNLFFRNRGDGTFEDATARWGGADPGPSTCAAFFDADQDGDLDLYVGNYVDYDPANPPNGGQPCEWKGLRISCGPLGTPAVPATFWENRDGTLVEATKAFGFEAPGSYALGAVAADCDLDGDTDLYVANDSRPNFFFENLGKGRFRECANTLGCAVNEEARSQSSMGIEAGDVDNDGLPDLFVTNFSHDTNTLYRAGRTRDGRLNYDDVTFNARLGEASYPYLSWGTRFLDVDLDGWRDIVVVSGHVYPQVEGANLGTSYAQLRQIFRNLGLKGPRGGVVFEELKPRGAFTKAAVSRGLAAADLDDDGDAELLVTVLDGKPALLRNDTRGAGHWIGFELRGAGRNRDAIGARLEVTDAAGVTRHAQRTFGAGYLSTSDPRIVVGLGEAGGGIAKLVVRWPDGRADTHAGLAADRYWRLEPGAGPRPGR